MMPQRKKKKTLQKPKQLLFGLVFAANQGGGDSGCSGPGRNCEPRGEEMMASWVVDMTG